MHIPFFGPHQTAVFLPAMLTALVPTLLVVIPVVFAPALTRMRGGAVIRVVCFVLAAAALVVVAVQVGAGFRVLADQRADVQAQVAERYGITVTVDEAGTLADGGELSKILPSQARQVGLKQTGTAHLLRVKELRGQSDDYALTFGNRTLPSRSG